MSFPGLEMHEQGAILLLFRHVLWVIDLPTQRALSYAQSVSESLGLAHGLSLLLGRVETKSVVIPTNPPAI